jgi:hypothetical protein
MASRNALGLTQFAIISLCNKSKNRHKKSRHMKILPTMLTSLILIFASGNATAETSILFIGNSFTYGYGSATRYYRADTVTDLNNEGLGGVPALFKSFTDQAALDYDVNLETRGGSTLDFHLENKQGVIGRRAWDKVVLQGYSTLDRDNPGDSGKLVSSIAKMVGFLHGLNSKIEVYLTATWSRADLTYLDDPAWSGKPIEQMARDVRAGYDKAAAGATSVTSVNAVGEAWTRAMEGGIADPNPYDGLELGKVNLWSYDHYHASNYGYYLEALVVFGNVTGLDPRSLGDNECSGYELGMSRSQINALQAAAFDQLASESRVKPAPLELPNSSTPERCVDRS